MWFIQLGLRTHFILKPDRFLTTAIFTGSASTVHNSFEIMFQNFTFWCYPGYDTCLSVLRIQFQEKGLISPAVKTPKLGQITALNFSDSSKLVRMG